MEAKDDNVLSIKYFGFRSGHSHISRYFYGCTNVPPSKFQDIKDSCRHGQVDAFVFNEFYKINDIAGARTDGYIFNFPLYVQTAQNAHIELFKFYQA